MDIIDRKVANQLQKNAYITHREIGIEIDLPTSTVNDRIRNLIKNGIIKQIMKVNPIKAKLYPCLYLSANRLV
jgi:DNA-binding Lrp family transcriptional regulator